MCLVQESDQNSFQPFLSKLHDQKHEVFLAVDYKRFVQSLIIDALLARTRYDAAGEQGLGKHRLVPFEPLRGHLHNSQDDAIIYATHQQLCFSTSSTGLPEYTHTQGCTDVN